MIKTLNKCIHIILDYPKIVLSFLVAVTIFFGSYISDIKMDFSIEQLFSQDDPVVERFLTLREEFDGVDNVIYLFYKSNDPFSYENLIKNRKMVDSFESIEGVSSVTSLTNIELFTETEEYLLSPVYNEIPRFPDSLTLAKKQIMNSNLLKNYLISEDGTIAGILIDIDPAFNDHDGREEILKEIDRLLFKLSSRTKYNPDEISCDGCQSFE